MSTILYYVGLSRYRNATQDFILYMRLFPTTSDISIQNISVLYHFGLLHKWDRVNSRVSLNSACFLKKGTYTPSDNIILYRYHTSSTWNKRLPKKKLKYRRFWYGLTQFHCKFIASSDTPAYYSKRYLVSVFNSNQFR